MYLLDDNGDGIACEPEPLTTNVVPIASLP
jgi:hypothetical protein